MGKPSLAIEVNGMKFKNPFVLGSGPPGTNGKVISRAFERGWGGVVAKTISMDNTKVINVAPRYGKLRSRETDEIIGFENIELISDRPYETWLKEFREVKAAHPEGMLIASVMEEYEKARWQKMVTEVHETGVDGFELNLSCPHGLPERKMGSAMGQSPEITEEVMSWCKEVTDKPVWAKMTPNITDITVPAQAAVKGGADGIAAINTILSIIGVDLDTLRPKPTVEGYAVPGGYSAQAVRPIALRHVSELGRAFHETDVTISGIGGRRDSSRRDSIHPPRSEHGANLHRCDAPRFQDDRRAQPRPRGLDGREELRAHRGLPGSRAPVLHHPQGSLRSPARSQARPRRRVESR